MSKLGIGNREQGTGNREDKRKIFFILHSELLIASVELAILLKFGILTE
jgi:hypothetical protein